MKSSFLLLVPMVICALPTAAQNMILNPDFENTTSVGCDFNLFNAQFTAKMANATAYGISEEIDIMTGPCIDLAPQSGAVKIDLHHVDAQGGHDAFTFDLCTPVIAGTSYELSFYAEARTGAGNVEIGLSNSAISFGTLVFTAPVADVGAWTLYCTTFVAPVGATHLSVEAASGGVAADLDNFCLKPVSSETPRFGTPPNPGTLVPSATGPPLLGGTWSPTVTGVPSTVDVVILSTLPGINVPLSFGTLLCNIPPPPLFFFHFTPGTPVPISVPSSCGLLGLNACAQGAGLTFGPLSINLTNALDLVVGI